MHRAAVHRCAYPRLPDNVANDGRADLRVAQRVPHGGRQHRPAERVGRVLRRTGLDPAYLDLELTESVVMRDADEASATLNLLRELGVGISIDDFGTGYTSMSQLEQMPLSTLKIEELIYHLKERYTIVIVTHNMQQAARVSDYTAFMHLGRVVEFDDTAALFTNPSLKQTEDYITGRYG